MLVHGDEQFLWPTCSGQTACINLGRLCNEKLEINTTCSYPCDGRDVLFEYHQVVVPFCWAVRPVRSLSTL